MTSSTTRPQRARKEEFSGPEKKNSYREEEKVAKTGKTEREGEKL